jgi:hypothetical protein
MMEPILRANEVAELDLQWFVSSAQTNGAILRDLYRNVLCGDDEREAFPASYQ